MIIMKPTAKLVGINVQGDYYDFDEFVDAAHRITGVWPDENYNDPYYASSNRLLGICYDIRHARQGDREIEVKDNGLNMEIMKWHEIIMQEQTIYYSVNILFPEAIFVATTLESLLDYAAKYYGKNGRKLKEKEELPFCYEYTQYVKDCGILRNFAGQIWGALGEAIGEVALENILRAQNPYQSYVDYAAQYIDKFDIDIIKAKPDKRAGKLKTIAKKIVVPDDSYYQMYRDMSSAARKYGCSMHELHDPSLEFPEEIDW